MYTKKKTFRTLCLILMIWQSLFSFSGCMLLPQEEEVKTRPVISSYDTSRFKMAAVQRGDLERTANVSFSYKAMEAETYSIKNGAYPFTRILHQVGDTVKAGELILQQDCTALEKELSECRQQLSIARMTLTQLEETRDLKTEHQETRYQLAGWEERQTMPTAQEVYDSFANAMKEQEDRIQILNLKIEEIREKIAQREIRSTINGTITYIAGMDERGNLKAPTNRKVCIVSNGDTSYFQLSTDYYEYFWPGDAVTLNINSEPTEAIVVDPEGIFTGERPEKPQRQSVKKNVYLELVVPDASIGNGTWAPMTLVLERSEDTLYVGNRSVKRVGDQYMIYYLDEKGILQTREIEIGMSTPAYTEILSGVEEGMLVIAQ